MGKTIALALGLFVIGSASFASATVQRVYHAANCQVASGTATFSSIGQIANKGSGTLVLYCPITYDITPNNATVGLPTSSAQLVARVYEYGCSNGLTPFVQMCFQPSGGGTGPNGSALCAPASSPADCQAGVRSLSMTIPSMSAGDYPYLVVSLPPGANGAYNTFWGYTLVE